MTEMVLLPLPSSATPELVLGRPPPPPRCQAQGSSSSPSPPVTLRKAEDSGNGSLNGEGEKEASGIFASTSITLPNPEEGKRRKAGTTKLQERNGRRNGKEERKGKLFSERNSRHAKNGQMERSCTTILTRHTLSHPLETVVMSSADMRFFLLPPVAVPPPSEAVLAAAPLLARPRTTKPLPEATRSLVTPLVEEAVAVVVVTTCCCCCPSYSKEPRTTSRSSSSSSSSPCRPSDILLCLRRLSAMQRKSQNYLI